MFNDEETTIIYNRIQIGSCSTFFQQGYSAAEASRSLGVSDVLLGRWVRQLKKESTGITPKSKALIPEQQRIKELEARIDRLEREKVILKKATALLMAEQMEHTR